MKSFQNKRRLTKHRREVRKANQGRKAHEAKEISIWKGFIGWMYLESKRVSQVRGVDVWSLQPTVVVALLEGEQLFINWLKRTSIEDIMTMLIYPFSAAQQQYARLAYASLCANKP